MCVCVFFLLLLLVLMQEMRNDSVCYMNLTDYIT